MRLGSSQRWFDASSARSFAIENPNPYETSGQGLVSERCVVGRIQLALESILVGTLFSVLMTLAYTAVWDRQARALGSIQQYDWAPFYDLDAMLCLMPFGFVIYSFFPTGWLFWGGFVAAQVTRSRYCYLLCAVAGIAFGFSWPRQCVGMLGI